MEHSASGTRCSSTGIPVPSTYRSSSSTVARPSSTSTTRCCPSSRRWGSSTATRLPRPDALVCWEAQFGDFANGAQSILDEFISSGEQKWGQRSSVVLLLPHGYEGQGPDHSSAKIERFLGLCAQDNMTVAQPSTPANYFHLLRWQALSGRGKPLVVFTPKSLLRLKAAASAVSDFTGGTFRPLDHDPAGPWPRVGPPGTALLRQGVLRPGRAPRIKRCRCGHDGDHAGRTPLPAAGRRAESRSRRLPGRARSRLGAG